MNALSPASDPRTERILRDYAILEDDAGAVSLKPTLREDFADLVKLAAMICDAPLSFVTFVGDDTQWIGARAGADLESTPRNESFCAHAMTGRDVMIVPDARRDPRFADNVFVTQPPYVRFYAGVPLISPEGVALGALCVLDVETRDGLSEKQLFALKTLAAQVMERLESQRRAAWRARIQSTLLDLTSGTEFVRLLEWNVASARDEGHAESGIAGFCDAAAVRAFLAKIHVEDRDAATSAIGQAIDTGHDLLGEWRVNARDDVVRRILVRGRVVGDVDGDRRFAGIVTDVTAQRAAEKTSADSEDRFRVLADTMPQMVWSTRADGFHDYYNARWYDYTGVPQGSTDGEEWNGMFHPDDRDRAWERWRHSLSTGEPYEIEYRLRHHTGQYRWVLGRALPIRDASGEIVRWFGTCTDVHETKVAAEERELVAQELSHRIKNTFLVIAGLIGLYARHNPATQPFAREIRERIIALGRAHNFVRPHTSYSRTGDVSVTFQGLIGELAEPYRLNGQSRIQLIGDDLPIDDRAATPLALLIHELATNAAKYGALSALGGTVDIEAQLRDDRFIVSWTEKGGPTLADVPPTEGFGTRVSKLSVESQLGGSLQRFWNSDGLKVVADIPRASLARQASRPSVFSGVSGTA